jgi:hypothetical protein
VSEVAVVAVSSGGAELVSRATDVSADVTLSVVVGAYPRVEAVSTGGFGRTAAGLCGREAGRAFGVGPVRGTCCSTGDTGWVPREEISVADLFDVSGGATRRGRSAWFTTEALRSGLPEQADRVPRAAKARMSRFIGPPECRRFYSGFSAFGA